MTEGPDNSPQVTVGSVEVTDLGGFAKIADRLLTFFERAFGPVVRPTLDSWANRKALADTKDAIQLLRSNGLELSAAELSNSGRTSVRAEFARRREEDNQVAIAALAFDALEHEVRALPPPSGPLPDFDLEWLDHYWDLARRISSEGRQALWARILAREAAGGHTSARALSLLSTLSSAEAKELERLASYTVRVQRGEYDAYGILFDIYHRQSNKEAFAALTAQIGQKSRTRYQRLFGSIGILIEDGWAFTFSAIPKNNEIPLLIAGRPYRIVGDEKPLVAGMNDVHGLIGFGNGVELSPIGAEILNLIEPTPDPEFLSLIAQALDQHGWALLGPDGSAIGWP